MFQQLMTVIVEDYFAWEIRIWFFETLDHFKLKTRPSLRVHWVACGTCTVPNNFFQVGGSLRPFKGSPRSHTSRGPFAHKFSHVRTTKKICPCVICSSNSARYCFGIVYHCSAMVEALGKWPEKTCGY